MEEGREERRNLVRLASFTNKLQKPSLVLKCLQFSGEIITEVLADVCKCIFISL